MTDIPTWHERAMRHPDHQSGMVSEDMIRARMCEEIADLRADVERLQGLLRSFSRNEAERVSRLIRERNELLDELERLRGAAQAEVERLTRERDEARAALEPFSELYLWPDDAGRLTAERVRSGKDWDEAANDAESNEYGITRGDIRAARRAMEAKP